MILANAEASPDKIIVKDANGQWTWSQLMQRARGYAGMIEASGVARGAIVPILVGRSGESVAAILGCLLAGRAFSPLSVDQPEARLSACLSRMDARFVLADLPPPASAKEANAPEIVAGLPVLRTDKNHAKGVGPVRTDGHDQGLLYVLFTSGSTGQPKGVMVDHGNILNTLAWSSEMLEWNGDDVIGVAVNLYFDIAMFDLFCGLCGNIPLGIISNAADIHRTCGEIRDLAITSIFAAPVFFSQFVRSGVLDHADLHGLRRIVSGGDFFAPAHVLAWMNARPDVAIYNVWGPTETSIVNTMHRVGPDDRPSLERGLSAPVGRAHPRMPFVLLDESLEAVEGAEAKGEICMQGPCVTVGYLKDPERTASAYIMLDGVRSFRTGDLGSVDAKGDLRIHGRIGSLIKVAGHRIDVGEVEGAATRAPEVHAAAAFLHDVDVGLQELWLALELRPDCDDIALFAFKKQLREVLPSYMVPKKIVVVKSLPTTPNLKIDRRAISDAFQNDV